ncbi:MAG: phosphoribosylaminoimidazolesuccinocarboxamide synthase [bacterium]|nr:phosphoribosylaminoimidazolesuccinocarboxamide synthase [bacterium]
MEAVTNIKIPGVKKFYNGKVRDLYKIDKEHLLIVSSDRFSAFDHVFPKGIPGKGVILNKIANLWFSKIKFINNHIVEENFNNFPKPFCDFPELLKDRSVIVKRTKRIDFECVARGYIIGSGWKDYQKSGKICGIPLPEGLQLAEQLDAPLFTPATKADSGHDINVSINEIRDKLGDDIAGHLGEVTLNLYEFARELMDSAGIILADTKFEFGFSDNELILIDEVLTPDSSSFWDKSAYSAGSSPVSFDKQFILDYLETTSWDKNSSPPPLPDEIVEKTQKIYETILKRIKEAIIK